MCFIACRAAVQLVEDLRGTGTDALDVVGLRVVELTVPLWMRGSVVELLKSVLALFRIVDAGEEYECHGVAWNV